MDAHVSERTTSDKQADEDIKTSDDTFEYLGTARADLSARQDGPTASFSWTGLKSSSRVSKAGKKRSKSSTNEDSLNGDSDRKERRFKKPWCCSKNDEKSDSKKDKKDSVIVCRCCERGKKCCCCCCKKATNRSHKEERDKYEADKIRERDGRSRDCKREKSGDKGKHGKIRDSDESEKLNLSSDSSDTSSDRKSFKERRRDHSREFLRESIREGRHELPCEFRRQSPRELVPEIALRECELVREPLREFRRDVTCEPLRETRRELREYPRELVRESSRESRRDLRETSRREPIRELLREPPRECRREISHESLREPPREIRREPVKEYRRDPCIDYRHEPFLDHRLEPPTEYRPEPKSDSRHEPAPEYRHEPATEHRYEPPRDYLRSPPRDCRHEPARELRREPSKDGRREAASDCRRFSDVRHETANESRRGSPHEPSRDGHWDHFSCDYHQHRSSGCRCKSSCYKCRSKRSKEDELQSQHSCCGNRNSTDAVKGNTCLPVTPNPQSSNAVQLPRTNSYVLIKCVPCTLQQSEDNTSKPVIKTESYQQGTACTQPQIQIQNLASPAIVPSPAIHITRNPGAGQGLSLGPSYVPLAENNFNRPQPVLSLTAPTVTVGLSQTNGQLQLNRVIATSGHSLNQTPSKTSNQLPSSSQHQAGGHVVRSSPSNHYSPGGQYYSATSSPSGGAYSTNNPCSQPASPSHAVSSHLTSPTIQYAVSDRTSPCGQYLSTEQNQSFTQQQGSAQLQSSAHSLHRQPSCSSAHGQREGHNHNNNSSSNTPTTEDPSQTFTPHPYQTLVMCTPCAPNCCSPPCGPRPCCNPFPPCGPCGPSRACCSTNVFCEPCIPQPELRRHPHAHCRHPADFRSQPPEYRCPVSCVVRVGCRLRTIHPYLTRPPCINYTPGPCPCPCGKRFTDHCGAHFRTPHARHGDDIVVGATCFQPDVVESGSRHRHVAERTFSGHYYRSAHCRHQIVDSVMNGRNSTARKQQPSPPPMTRTRVPREAYAACSTTYCDPPCEVDTAPVTRPSSAS